MKNQMNNIIEDEGIDLDNNFNAKTEIAKFKDAKPQGWTIMVRLFTKPKKTHNGIIIPDKTHNEQRYQNCTGLVVAMSDAAYKDEQRYSQTGPWCKVGDWIVFPRHAGYIINYNGLPTYVLKEDAIDIVVSDPRIVSR